MSSDSTSEHQPQGRRALLGRLSAAVLALPFLGRGRALEVAESLGQEVPVPLPARVPIQPPSHSVPRRH